MILKILVFFALVFAVQIPLRKRELPAARVLVFLLKLILIPGAALLIVADHQPYDRAQLAAQQSALQLSGHTHAGQLWPLQIVYRILGLPALGEFREPGTLLYVSAGEGVWRLPLRTEAGCEWEYVTLIPAAR